MAPVATQAPPGPHPSYIQVAKPYMFEHQIQAAFKALGSNEIREANNRLQGVAWIDTLRKSMNLPVKTYDVACVYYHKFRLAYTENEFNYVDASTAALFTACKVMDTLKKSREILCAGHNLKVSAAERVAPDDAMFEGPSRTITSLERMMLEVAGFDFRSRVPQDLIIKLCKSFKISQSTFTSAFYICNDLYRTFAPLKQTTAAMAHACIELALKIADEQCEGIDNGDLYSMFKITRAEVMETILDLLDLYTNHRASTIIGAQHPLETFIDIRIGFNQEATRAELPRYTNWADPEKEKQRPSSASAKNGTHHASTNGANKENPSAESSGAAATLATAIDPTSVNGTRGRLGERGRDGTVRFMLNPERAREEQGTVSDYFEDREEEYEVEVDVERPARRD